MFTCAVFMFLSSSCFAALPLPSYIKPCALNDPDFNECARKSAIAAIPQFIHGDPKYKIPDLDPMLITEIRITEGTRSVGMTMQANNGLLSGLKSVEMRATRFDFDKKRIEYDWYFPNLVIRCIYNVTGRVLLLPIVGHGNGSFDIHSIEGTYGYDYDLVKKKDSKMYMVPKNPKFEFIAKKLTMHLDNLFNGDKFLGENMNRFLNENWQDILRDVGPPIAEAIAQFINQILTNVFSLVPFKVAIPDTLE